MQSKCRTDPSIYTCSERLCKTTNQEVTPLLGISPNEVINLWGKLEFTLKVLGFLSRSPLPLIKSVKTLRLLAHSSFLPDLWGDVTDTLFWPDLWGQRSPHSFSCGPHPHHAVGQQRSANLSSVCSHNLQDQGSKPVARSFSVSLPCSTQSLHGPLLSWPSQDGCTAENILRDNPELAGALTPTEPEEGTRILLVSTRYLHQRLDLNCTQVSCHVLSFVFCFLFFVMSCFQVYFMPCFFPCTS